MGMPNAIALYRYSRGCLMGHPITVIIDTHAHKIYFLKQHQHTNTNKHYFHRQQQRQQNADERQSNKQPTFAKGTQKLGRTISYSMVPPLPFTTVVVDPLGPLCVVVAELTPSHRLWKAAL